MNYKQMLKTAALSTLLLSAVGAPSALAETADNTNPAPVKLTETVMAKKILDPLKLAETYAPETVEDWKKALADYESLTTKFFWTDVVDGKAGDIQVIPLSEVKTVEGGIDGTFDVSLKELKTVDGTELFKTVTMMKTLNADSFALEPAAADINVAEAGAYSDETTATAVPFVKFATVASGEAVRGTIADMKEMGTAGIAISVSSSEDSSISAFAQGWKQLEEAVQSGDGQAIKQALANQLEQYKQRITELQNAKTDVTATTLQAIPALPSVPAASTDKE